MNNYPDNRKDFGAEVRVSLALGREFTAGDYIKAQRIRTRVIDMFRDIYKDVDAIVTPATGITAPEVSLEDAEGGWSDLTRTTETMRYVFPGNLAGLPAISFPAHRHAGHGPLVGGGPAAAHRLQCREAGGAQEAGHVLRFSVGMGL
jgi:Asp-tRNA(Asn)/Glu-tRNA(Gln) amidotransferase A subunit family amidase